MPPFATFPGPHLGQFRIDPGINGIPRQIIPLGRLAKDGARRVATFHDLGLFVHRIARLSAVDAVEQIEHARKNRIDGSSKFWSHECSSLTYSPAYVFPIL